MVITLWGVHRGLRWGAQRTHMRIGGDVSSAQQNSRCMIHLLPTSTTFPRSPACSPRLNSPRYSPRVAVCCLLVLRDVRWCGVQIPHEESITGVCTIVPFPPNAASPHPLPPTTILRRRSFPFKSFHVDDAALESRRLVEPGSKPSIHSHWPHGGVRDLPL